MPNYKESEVQGTAWVRADRIQIHNPYGGMPSIHFSEEQVVEIGDGQVIRQPYAGALPVMQGFDDPATEFALLHPDTGAVLGSATYADFQVLLYSLYRHLADKRDATPPTPVGVMPVAPQ